MNAKARVNIDRVMLVAILCALGANLTIVGGLMWANQNEHNQHHDLLGALDMLIHGHTWGPDNVYIKFSVKSTATKTLSVLTTVVNNMFINSVAYGGNFTGTTHTLDPEETGTIIITYPFSSGVKYDFSFVTTTDLESRVRTGWSGDTATAPDVAGSISAPFPLRRGYHGPPAVCDSIVAWQDSTNGSTEIYVYDLSTSTEKQITNSSAAKDSPDVHGSVVVWRDFRNGNPDIYMYNLSTSTENGITTNSANQYDPAIYGNTVVWTDMRNGNGDIYMFDLSTSTETRITNNTAYQIDPDVSGNLIAWTDGRNGKADIYIYDLLTKTEVQITTDPADQANPAVYGNIIVWEDYRNGLDNADIYMYDLSTSTEKQITTDPANQRNPDVYGSIIVWQDDRNATLDIYMYDLSTSTEIQITADVAVQISTVSDPDQTFYLGDEQFPSIYGNVIVWKGEYDLYV